MPGRKTHEQQVRMFERKDDVPKPGEVSDHLTDAEIAERSRHSAARIDQADEPGISTGHRAAHQESRDHNKHNNPGQSGHKPPKPSPRQQKH